MSQSDAAALQRNTIEPALRRDDWTGAAVAAANGLDTPSTSTGPSTESGFTWSGAAGRAGPPRPRHPGAVVVDPPAPAQAARSRVRRGPAGGPVGPERAGRGADRRARRSLQGHRGRRRAAVRTSDSALALAVEEFRRCADRSVQPRGHQRQDDAGAGVQRPSDPRRRRARVHGATPRPAHPRGGRRRQGRSGTGRADGGIRQAARSGHQRALPVGHADSADGRPHCPPGPVGAGAGDAPQPIRRCRIDFGRRECGNRQAAVGVRRSEHHHRAGTRRSCSGRQMGLVDAVRAAESSLGQGPFAARCGRHRRRRHQSRRGCAAGSDHGHQERHQPSRRPTATGTEHPPERTQRGARPGGGRRHRCREERQHRPSRRLHPPDQGRRRPGSPASQRRRGTPSHRTAQSGVRPGAVLGAIARPGRLGLHRHPPGQHRA